MLIELHLKAHDAYKIHTFVIIIPASTSSMEYVNNFILFHVVLYFALFVP